MTKTTSLGLVRSLLVAGAAIGLWIYGAPRIHAQAGITITSPTSGTIVKAGPDFATDVLNDPWDFSNREDVAIDPAQIVDFSNFAVSGGLAGGTALDTSASFFTLQRAWYNILNPGRTGRRFPISSATYTKLAFKVNLGDGTRHPRVYWFHNDIGDPTGDASGWLYLDPNVTTPSGNGIYTLDMTQVNQNGINQGTPWTTGAVTGLAMFPNDQSSSVTAQFDWVRLTTADSNAASPNMHITWTGGSGTIAIKATDANGVVYTVNNAVSASQGSYDWKYGFLPPGTYTLTVGSASTLFKINSPPSIAVTDPDQTGGADFATNVLLNPWDMNDNGDFFDDHGVTIVDHLTSENASNGLFTGVSDGVAVACTAGTLPSCSGGVPVGDPQLYLLSNGSASNTTNVIDTTKYHRLTFSLNVQRSFDLQHGSVARVFWGGATGPGAPYNLTTTKDIIAWPGMNTYTIDLATLTTATNGGLETANATPWTAQPVRHLRIDPHEFPEVITFNYGPVKLAADDETSNNSFTIKWTGSDADGDAATVSLYYDNDLNPNNGKTLIASGLALSTGQYVWNTSSVPSGTYYIYAVASDSYNATGQYSTGPVKVSTFTPPSNPAMGIDTPTPNQTVTSAFEVGGWALDLAAPSGSTGVDNMQFYAFPNDGAGAPVFLGTGSYGWTRSDVAAVYGSQFTNVGYHFTVTGMMPGKYMIGIYAHSTVSSQYFVGTVHITVGGTTLMSIDAPSPESTISASSFGVSGWAIDTRGTTTTGVDQVHVYAYPNPGSGQPPIFLGVAQYGAIQRQDVANLYGPQFVNSGYVLNISRAAAGLGPGVYNIVCWTHNSITNSFTANALMRVTLQ